MGRKLIAYLYLLQFLFRLPLLEFRDPFAGGASFYLPLLLELERDEKHFYLKKKCAFPAANVEGVEGVRRAAMKRSDCQKKPESWFWSSMVFRDTSGTV